MDSIFIIILLTGDWYGKCSSQILLNFHSIVKFLYAFSSLIRLFWLISFNIFSFAFLKIILSYLIHLDVILMDFLKVYCRILVGRFNNFCPVIWSVTSLDLFSILNHNSYFPLKILFYQFKVLWWELTWFFCLTSNIFILRYYSIPIN